jgi:hypothetical protein
MLSFDDWHESASASVEHEVQVKLQRCQYAVRTTHGPIPENQCLHFQGHFFLGSEAMRDDVEHGCLEAVCCSASWVHCLSACSSTVSCPPDIKGGSGLRLQLRNLGCIENEGTGEAPRADVWVEGSSWQPLEVIMFRK